VRGLPGLGRPYRISFLLLRLLIRLHQAHLVLVILLLFSLLLLATKHRHHLGVQIAHTVPRGHGGPVGAVEAGLGRGGVGHGRGDGHLCIG
jgi:hypothetical protein